MDLDALCRNYYSQFPLKIRILRYLGKSFKEKNISQTDIQNKFGLGKSYISEVTSELKNEGLVSKRREGRRKINNLTDKGFNLLEKLFKGDLSILQRNRPHAGLSNIKIKKVILEIINQVEQFGDDISKQKINEILRNAYYTYNNQ